MLPCIRICSIINLPLYHPKLLRHKCSVGTLEAERRVLLRASIETDNARRLLLLRVDVDAVGLEAAA